MMFGGFFSTEALCSQLRAPSYVLPSYSECADARKTLTKIRICAKNFHALKKLLSAKQAFFSL
jgi:hypothetical protein